MKKQSVKTVFGVKIVVATGALLLLATFNSAFADEGMWAFHNPPIEQVAKKYGVKLTPEWLEHLRLSSVRYGSSSSFVSADGLILTNHHVVFSCVQRLSSEKEDLAREGFLGRTLADERVCPGAEATMLVSYQDVTKEVAEAQGSAPKRQQIIAGIEKKCTDDNKDLSKENKLRCQVVTLYRGGQYWLYRYKVWQDVRLVWAPEARLGSFGGDADNFVYPRYALDAAFVRAYEDGKPVKPQHFLQFAKDGIKDGDVIFSAGNPGSTDRAMTVAELNFQRQQRYPIRLNSLNDAHDALLEFGKLSPESQRRANDPLFGIENGLKVVNGETKALAVERLHQRKRADETDLQAKAKALIAKKEFRFLHGDDPWTTIAAASKKQHEYAFAITGTDYGFGNLAGVANETVALAMESKLPTGERLRAYRDSSLPQIKRAITSPRVWYRDLEEVRLAQKMDEAMSYLGQEHPFVARMLKGEGGKIEAPKAAAKRIMSQTKFDDVNVRRALVDGGEKAVRESTDALVSLVRDLYPIWRAIREREQREVDAVKEAAHDDIARLRFHLKGVTEAPDATSTLRFTFGRVAGFDRDGIQNPWMTSFYGLYERNLAFGNKPPFDLPTQWLSAKNKLNLETPFDYVTNLDIIGGSSGSPAVNAKGELVGVLFDGNLESLGNRFQYQDRTARALAVDSRAIIETLDKVYGAKELVGELTAGWAK